VVIPNRDTVEGNRRVLIRGLNADIVLLVYRGPLLIVHSKQSTWASDVIRFQVLYERIGYR